MTTELDTQATPDRQDQRALVAPAFLRPQRARRATHQESPETRQDLRALVAQETGLESGDIGSVYLQLQMLRRQGILVDVDIHGTTMFARSASLAELGVPRQSLRGKRIRPGQKDLIPRSVIGKLKSVEQRMRDCLNKYGQDVTGFRPYRYLHFAAYQPFRERWEKLEREFEAIKADIIENLDDYHSVFLEEYAGLAKEAWDAMMASNGHERVLIVHLKNGGSETFEGPDDFVDWVTTRAAPLFPTEAKVLADLHADYKTAILVSQADVAAEEARRDQAVAESAQAAAEHTEATERERVARSEAQIQMEAIRQAELEHARQQLEQVVSPFEELFGNLRAQVYTDARAVADSIRRNGFLNPQVARRVDNLVTTFQMLNATDDVDLATLLDTLRTAAQATPRQTGKAGHVTPGDTVALDELSAALGDVVTATHDAAVAVATRSGTAADLVALEI